MSKIEVRTAPCEEGEGAASHERMASWMVEVVAQELRLALPEIEHRVHMAIDRELTKSDCVASQKSQFQPMTSRECTPQPRAAGDYNFRPSWPKWEEMREDSSGVSRSTQLPTMTPSIDSTPKQLSKQGCARVQDHLDLDPVPSEQLSSNSEASGGARSNTGNDVRKSDCDACSGPLDRSATVSVPAETMESVIFKNAPQNECFKKIKKFVDWIKDVEEPERTGWLKDLIHNKKFDILCVAVISLNAIFAAYKANWEIENLGKKPGNLIRQIELTFSVFYIIELGLKLSLHRLYFFVNEEWRWNFFDLVLVVFGVYDEIFSLFIKVGSSGGKSSTGDLTFMRILKIMKVTKVMRLFRVLRFFRELRMLMTAIGRSFSSLFWCLLMLAFILYIFGLVMLQGLVPYLIENEEELPEKTVEFIILRFGTLSRTMLSLYKSSTGGADWQEYYDIISNTGPMYSFFFIFYIAFFTFAVFNILTGMFVDSVLALGEHDDDVLMMQYRQRKIQIIKDMKRLFMRLDRDLDGSLSLYEFQTIAGNDQVRAIFQQLELDIKDATLFFKMLLNVSGNGKVDLDTFLSGCIKMKGAATSIDLECLAFQTKMIQNSVQQVESHLCDMNHKLAHITKQPKLE